MRICVLVSSYESSSSWLKDIDPLMDPTPWLDGHEVQLVPIRKDSASSQVEALAAADYDLFINLCDGSEDEDTAGVEVCYALERLGLPFTGAGSDCFALRKVPVKEHVRRAGILTPDYVLASHEEEVEQAAQKLRFPLIVKHPSGYCSVGMTRNSRVECADALRRESQKMMKSYGEVLIEEFIIGQEATVLVVENADAQDRPRVFEPLFYVFPPGESFKHEDIKWRDFANGHYTPCGSPELAAALKELTARSFVHLGLRGYARIDFRIDPQGVPYFLECNTNCGVFYPAYTAGGADVTLLKQPDGYREFLDLLFRSAFARQAEPESLRHRAPPDIAVRSSLRVS